MELFTAMRKRRMHRAFAPELPDPGALERLLWAGGRAPTARAGVRQFLLIEDPALMRAIRQTCPGFINDAPLAVLIFSDLSVALATVGTRGQEVIARVDAGTAAGYISLAAPALGLGVCLTTSWSEAVLQELLGLPEHCRPEVLIAIGKIAESPSRTVRATPPKVHVNAYGTLRDHQVG